MFFRKLGRGSIMIMGVFFLAACGDGESDPGFDPSARDTATLSQFAVLSKYKLRDQLRDPSSAVYRSVKIYQHPRSDGGVVFCGEVNAKNGVGGMAAYERFVATPTHAVLESMGPTEFQSGWNKFCTSSRFIKATAWF
tara:strand:- start:20 stop:433 length:414 start_codon:yes stop_codon:yes gene_type:complete